MADVHGVPNEVDDAIESFDIAISPDEGQGGLHTKNNPHQPFQRTTIHEERRSVNIKCSLVDVAHGYWGPDSDDYATLIVLDFRFNPGRRSRIAAAKIIVAFWGETDADDHPGVADISLNGSYSLVQTTQTETITNGIGGTVGVNVMQSGNISLDKKWEKVVNRTTSDATYVSGTTCMIGVDTDPANAAEWKLRENETLKTGVPAGIRVGILLKRENEENFKCTVQIESDVDLKSSIGRWFGGKPKDDPVLFKPSMKPSNKLMKYDTENLGSFDLKQVEDVTFVTVLDGVIKNSTVNHSGTVKATV